MEVENVSQQVFLECFQQVLTQICNADERVLANQPTSPKEAETAVEPMSPTCPETSVGPVVEEPTEPSLDVSVAAKNAGNEEVKNSLPSTSQLTLILNNHFLRIRLRIATAISAQKD
jgi:hypothetical protein